MFRSLPWLGLLLVWGCEEGGGLAPVESTLDPVPERLDFGGTYLGTPKVLPLVLTARGGAIQVQSASVTGSLFSLGSVPERLLPGGPQRLALTFTPQTGGPAEGRLSLGLDAPPGTVEVILQGLGLPIPDCDDASVCTQDTFDAATGQCQHDPIPGPCDDHSACTEGDTCSEGVCVGRAIQCSDGVACTRDLCDPGLGCTSIPDDSRCGDDDLCTLDRCQADGCAHPPAPEGSACGPATICEAPGLCQAGACVRTPIEVLQPEWSVAGTDTLVFPGLVDADDNVYWLDCPQVNGSRLPCNLVSVTAQGVTRFDVLIGRAQGLAILAGALVIVAEGTGVEARRQSDGGLVWTATLPMGTCNGTFLNPTITALAADRDSVLVGARGTSCAPSTITRLELDTGFTTWRFDALSGSPSLAIDLANNVYGVSGPKVISFDPAGALRWSFEVGPPSTVPKTSVAGGLIWSLDLARFVEPRSYALADGSPLALPALTHALEPSPIISDGLITFLSEGTDRFELITGPVGQPELYQSYPLHPLAGGNTRPEITQLELTERGTVIFLEHHFEPRIYEYRRSGELLASCALANSEGRYHYGSAYGDRILSILDGHLVLAKIDGGGLDYVVQGFAAPGLRPATSGWVGANGSRARDHRPR